MKQRNATLQALVTKANQYLANDTAGSPDGREMLFIFVQALLMEANSYRGFNYLYWDVQGGCEEWKQAGSPEGAEKDVYLYGPSGDKSRVRFY